MTEVVPYKIRMRKSLLEALKLIAERNNRSVNAEIAILLEESLKNEGWREQRKRDIDAVIELLAAS